MPWPKHSLKVAKNKLTYYTQKLPSKKALLNPEIK